MVSVRTARLTLLTAIGVALAGCTPGPEWDRRTGATYSRMVADEMGLVEDPALERYVASIGQRIASHVPDRRFDFSFRIVDQEVPNAFALPGGYVYVSRGILALTNSEDELANVLAHEMGHVEQRHAARQQAAATLPGFFTLPGTIVSAIVSPALGDVLASPFRQVGAVYLAGYGRSQEREADRFAQETTARAGYDPRGMSDLLDALGREEDLRQGDSPTPGFLDTHPPTPERAATTARRAATLAGSRTAGTEPDRAAYLRRLEGLAVGRDPRHGIFVGVRLLHALLDCSARIPAGWAVASSRGAFGAMSPEGDAILVLQPPARGTDPQQAADAFVRDVLASSKVHIERSHVTQVAGMPGYEITARLGNGDDAFDLEFAWLAHDGRIYRFTGVAPVANPELIGAIRATISSFRPLTELQRSSIRVNRLHLAEARPGESIRALSARTNNLWSTEQTAVMNGIAVDDTFTGGQLVKIAVRD